MEQAIVMVASEDRQRPGFTELARALLDKEVLCFGSEGTASAIDGFRKPEDGHLKPRPLTQLLRGVPPAIKADREKAAEELGLRLGWGWQPAIKYVIVTLSGDHDKAGRSMLQGALGSKRAAVLSDPDQFGRMAEWLGNPGANWADFFLKDIAHRSAALVARQLARTLVWETALARLEAMPRDERGVASIRI